MANNNNVEALTAILSALKDLDQDSQVRTLQAVVTFLDIPLFSAGVDSGSHSKVHVQNSHSKSEVPYTENRSMSPKDFLRDKAPKTAIERIICLGYYLTHYRDTPHFKTVDLSGLNTEAAQPKLSNPAVAVDNATKAGLLVQAIKGSKQISAAGESYVLALPDRDAARASISSIRTKTKRRSKKSPAKKSETPTE